MGFPLARCGLLYALQIVFVLSSNFVNAVPTRRNAYHFVHQSPSGDSVFQLGNVTYLANVQHPKAAFPGDGSLSASAHLIPFTVIRTNATSISKATLEKSIQSYAEGDDVFSTDFLEGICIISTLAATLDSSAAEYLASLDIQHVFTNELVKVPFNSSFHVAATKSESEAGLPAGPYAASISTHGISFATVYRLYEDTYRDFLFGAYDSNDGQGNHNALGVFLPNTWDVMIPVPSRIYSWGDGRPLAGERVGIKDLYDVKGLQTSGGSKAWAYITPIANESAPSVQRIIDLGGVIVGKQKLAQFASGANPWEWQDEHYPFNPRGDGWLTCSASSSGGGCSIAAYDWLDYAIGSDTGSSMRRPAAVSGIYGQRPSQGMISLERVLPLGGATDTAGVFSRDPYKWIKFSKAWYTPSLHQGSNITGLSPLAVPDTNAFPKRVLYPTDYLPLNNSAAEPILTAFISNLTTIFNMTLERINFTATIQNLSDPVASNFTTLSGSTTVINTYSQWTAVGKPLKAAWAALFDGRFPPIDPARRAGWVSFNESRSTPEAYASALVTKNMGVQAYEKYFQYSTPESCSESVMLYDIGPGGLPSYREEDLNNSPNASFLAVLPETAKVTGANICPIFGCADFTVPIGQVPYFSSVTRREEMVPVTINMVVKRGCDFVLYNMIEKLADAGVLKTVKTGRTAF